MKTFAWSLITILLLTTLAHAEQPSGTANTDPIRIGGAFALSGIAAPYGDGELKGATLAIEEINSSGGVLGRPLEMVVEDTKTTQVGTVSAVTKLTSLDKVDIIVGPTWLDSYQAAIPVAERNNAFLITPSAVAGVMRKSKDQSPRVFTTFANMTKEIVFILESIKQAGHQKIALIYDQDPFFEWVHSSLRAEATRLGLEITADVTLQIGATDIRMEVAKLRNAQAILVGFVDGGTILSFLKSRQTLIPKIELFGTHDTAGYSVDPAYKGLYSGTSYAVPAAARPSFIAAYSAKYGEEPKITASMSYDTVKIIAAALTKSKLDRGEFLRALQTEKFDTVTFGLTGFDELGGIAAGEFELKRVPF